MASVPQTPMVEPQTFSYAQAAKGRSPSFSSLLQPGKAVSEIADTAPKGGIHANGKTSNDSTKITNSRRASEGQVAKDALTDKGSKTKSSSEHAAQKSANSTPPTPHHKQDASIQSTISMPSSPDFSSVSASALLKEDDLSATPNDSSDATWDKQSQVSQNGEKTSSKGDVDKEEVKSAAWEQAQSQPILKEAPLPSVNVWQKRALDQQAKVGKDVKAQLPQAVIAPLFNHKAGQSITTKKENNIDSAKQDSKKQKPPIQKNEDGMTSPGSKDSWKYSDRRNRNGDEEKISTRGPRGAENVKPTSIAPPPPGDAMSWPTFENAQNEDKRKTQEKPEKGEKEKTPKPHGKEKWVPVPYVPTAVFNTPLPPSRRGGRPARGGREGNVRGGHASQGSIGGEKQSPGLSSPTGAPMSSTNEQAKGDMGPPRAGPLTPKPRRAASAGPPLSREQKKDTEANAQEKANEVSSSEPRPSQSTNVGTAESRRASTATQTDGPHHGRRLSSSSTWTKGAMQQGRKPLPSHMDFEDRSRNPNDHAHPKSAGLERKSDASMRPPDFSRESNGYPHHRERVDSRSDRGRGGFRGNRGGPNGFNGNHPINGQNFPNGHSPNPGVPVPKAQSYNERQLSQPSIGPFNSPQRERSYRTGTRSQSIPNPPIYGRYPNGPQSATQMLPPLQTHAMSMYDYDPNNPAIMSAMPYPPYIEQMPLLGMVQMQMEYYFSLDNLCKDMFLRKHMDSQGFVFLSVLTKFNRIKQLTSDVDLIKYVCRNAPSIEICTGVDGVDRVRKKEGWQQWVLAVEEREETAKNDGPTQMQQPNMIDGAAITADQHPMAWRALYNPAVVEDANLHTIPGLPQNFAASEVHSAVNGHLGDTQHTQQTPLSAAVPDFSPGLPLFNTQMFSPLDRDTSQESTFSDEQVESLMIVIRKPLLAQTTPVAPLGIAVQESQNTSAEDGTATNNLSLEDRPSFPTINGDNFLESHESDNRDFTSTQRSEGTPSEVFWVKGKETSAIGDLPEQISNVSYTFFRHQALKQRDHTPIGQPIPDMEILYDFWSHFLVRSYNARMYEQFRRLAYEDATQRDSTIGVKKLASYYNDSMLAEKVISDELARDYVDLVRDEIARHKTFQHERVAFEKLRSAWRNGATNLRNRVKVDRILDAALKAELED